jgi:adenylate kinase family enzyme
VSVVGNSGSGKTTAARAVARRLEVPHVELDGIFHQPGWTELSTEEFRERVRRIVATPSWVVDGNYSAVRDLVWDRADTVVWIDPPLPVVARRVVTRTVSRMVRRTELWNGNREPLSNLWSLNPNKSIIAWSLSRHSLYRRRFAAASVDPRWAHLTFNRLQTHRQVDAFVRHGAAAPTDQGANQ